MKNLSFKCVILIAAFLIILFFPCIASAAEKTLPKLGVTDPESNRFLCKSQMGAFLRYTGINNELKGEAKEGTDTFSIFIKGDEFHFRTDDKALEEEFEFEPLSIVKNKDGLIVAIQQYNKVENMKVMTDILEVGTFDDNFGRSETIIFNRISGLGSWIRNISNIDSQDIQAYSFTCQSVK